VQEKAEEDKRRNEGSKRVSTTWRATSARPYRGRGRIGGPASLLRMVSCRAVLCSCSQKVLE